MSASDSFENAFLLLLYNNTNFANVGDATGLRGSTTAGSLYASLHTADPGEAGAQNTSEATYTGYARVAIARSNVGFTVTGSSVANAAIVNFPACSAGSNTITYFGIGTAASGAGVLLFSGALTASLAVSAGITPNFAAGALTNVCD